MGRSVGEGLEKGVGGGEGWRVEEWEEWEWEWEEGGVGDLFILAKFVCLSFFLCVSVFFNRAIRLTHSTTKRLGRSTAVCNQPRTVHWSMERQPPV